MIPSTFRPSWLRAGLFSLLAFSIVCAVSISESAAASGFKPIFNGKDLSGWSGDENFWKVVDGAIVAESTPDNPCEHNTFLRWSAGEVDNFELKLKFRLSGTDQANSGIQFRSQVQEDGHVVGYQADLDRAGKWLGACYDERGRGLLAGRGQQATIAGPKQIERKSIADADKLWQNVDINDWNEYHIKAVGNELTLSVNGKVTARITDNDNENRDFAGVLALQLHSGPPMKIEFKDIHLKRLPLEGKKKIVFVAGSKSHGYFSHEHNAGCLLLAKSLDESDMPVITTVYQNGWPQDVTAFDNADTVVCYCDGGGRHFLNNHLMEFDQVMEQGVGLVCLHYAVETVIGEEGEHFLKWMGGYFEPNWSVNPHWKADFTDLPEHPITNGVEPFAIDDEWYYHMRFAKDMEGVTPILTDLPGAETLTRKDGPHSGNPYVREAVMVRKEPQHVAWAFNREGGGRGFGFTGGHWHRNWQHDQFRKIVLNAIAWTAKSEVPENGVQSPTPTVEEMKKNQDYEQPQNWEYQPPAEVKADQKKTAEKSGTANSDKSTTDKPLYGSPLITTDTKNYAVDVSVPIKGAKSLYLVVTDGGNGFSCDWADWAEPKLVGPDGTKKLTELDWSTANADWGQVKKNHNAGGGQLQIAGEPIEFGIGTHANSLIGYSLPENHKFEKFEVTVGLDNGGTDQGNQSSVQFFVFDQKPSAAFLSSKRSAPNTSNSSPASHELSDAVDQLEVVEGLELGLFAGEPRFSNPTNIDIDSKGRVWVCEVINYRQFRNEDSPEREAGDRILILTDSDGDGRADDTKVFYQGRDIDSAHGICVLGNRAIVSAGDSVFVLTDENGDDKADKKEVLFTGISGTQHDHGIHAFVFGPDGKLYFNFGNAGKQIKDKDGNPITDQAGNVVNDSRNPYQEGMVFRCNLDGSEFETLGWNFRNNWEVCVDSYGTMWQSDNDDDGNRGVRINYVMEYGNYGYKDELTGAGWRDPRTGWEEEIPRRHWHLNDPGVVPNLLQTGAGSPTGITIYEGNLLPEVFHNEIIHCDAGPNIVRAYPTQPDGAGYTAGVVNVLEGVNDNWFRPSDVCVAPDGSLFVADWYDPGVGGHRMADINRGRIFRLAPPENHYKISEIETKTLGGAIAALMNPNQATRFLGWTTLQNAGQAAVPKLKEMFNSNVPVYRARALWAIGKLEIDRQEKLSIIKSALKDEDSNIRITAIRLVRQLREEFTPEDVMDAINLYDPSSAVRRELLIALREIELPQAAQYWSDLATQYDGKDRWYLEALGIAAHNHWDEYLSEWKTRVGKDWNNKAGRDIVWRSRAKQTPELLIQLISNPQTPEAELPRYFRALDFHRNIDQNLLASLAFNPEGKEGPRMDFITAEAIERIQSLDFQTHPEYRIAIQELLKANPDSQTFLSIVSRFNLEDRYPDVMGMAINHSTEQLGVDAALLLLKKKQWNLLLAGMRQENSRAALQLAEVLGLTGDNRMVGPLTAIMIDQEIPIEVRRAAASSLGKTRPGTLKVVEYAQSNELSKSLNQVVASVMHTSTYRDVKEVANKLYPLPPSKDAKPLPPISELANRKGDPKNGRLIYHTTGTCAKCHQINGLGKEVGPDLSEIGKKLSKQALFESILYPSAGISHNYEAYTAVTIEGNIVSGLMVSQTDDSVTIKNAESITRTIPRDDLEELIKQDVSLMPADLQKVMTEEELVDVVEYLTTLKQKK